ncbi:hypothetical protein BDV32DRAFT_130016 [Aspergillus pseudonomiae]|uniref:Uncharacterized protein n=1 Tax=Aspergillus pseudonomiae TaxID=1506151 RepID=A0A5N7CVY1_9EURO|nr:uncharacterized protein BDV37DRAFT_263539 [Aspergillus pseudonomiae]KAB8255885.1 hypothetical protein BDV32DRAFT_130016 [Aspergillus pseudonomiae]KAE8398332.1 hypothetical protein BDV37DRAFT_263539 [Aspergillus pseudonomiae]
MPRPPTKRNRLTTTKASAIHKGKAEPSNECDVSASNTSRPPAAPDNQDEGISSQLVSSAQQGNTLRQSRNQTPLARKNEHAIESSPMGERGATGSRPPTRSRGYSSTLSMAGRKVDMSSRIPGTPAFESSILSNFRRRPRQASILQMMQAEDGSSDLDDDDFLGGLSPEDESTPLNLTRGKSLLVRQAVSPSPSQPSLPSSVESFKRKRSIEECQVSQSPPVVAENTRKGKSPHTGNEDSLELGQSLESLEAFNQTMAPPLSSSPLSSPVAPAFTSDSARPLNPIKQGARVHSDLTNEATTIPTATLQDRLLPRRRQRCRERRERRNVVELELASDSSGDDTSTTDQNDDELNCSTRRRTAKSKLKPYSEARRENEQRAGIVVNKGDKPKSSARIAKPLNQVRENHHETNSFTRPHIHTVTGEENQLTDMSSPLSSLLDSDALEFASLSESPLSVDFLSEELRLQAKKFAEVDKWEMEFEDVPGSQGSTLE